MDSMPDFDTKGPGFDSRSLHILFNSFFLLCQVLSETNFPCISTSNFPCECTKKLHQHSSMCQVLSETNFPCISTSNSPCECTKKLHQTLPVNVRKNYISFFRKRCRARYGRPSAGLRTRRPSATWRARCVGKNPQS